MTKCDVLVVGAGPAGSMAAKNLAERGVEVILIERNKEIGYPVRCAEGINKFLFRDTGIKKKKSFIRQKIDKTKIYFYDELYELNSNHWRGYTIDRRIFDKYLAKQAELAGAKVMTNTKAIGMNNKGKTKIVDIISEGKPEKIEAKVVVGAGGFDCKVGQWAGITKPWKLNEFSKCLEFELGNLDIVEHNAFHIAFGEEFPMGYGWIFPKSRDIANVGVGVDPRTDAKSALNFLMKEYPRITEIIGNEYSILETRGGGIPMTGPRSLDETVSDGIILVGDAAGIVDPITGEGISPSMLSGIAAGETISNALEKNSWDKNSLSDYYNRWRNKEYAGGLRLGPDLNMLTNIRDLFFKAFTRKDVSAEARDLFISAFISEDTENTMEIISTITGIVG